MNIRKLLQSLGPVGVLRRQGYLPVPEAHELHDLLSEHDYHVLLRLVRQKAGSDVLAEDILNEAVPTLQRAISGSVAPRSQQIGGLAFKVCMSLLRRHRRELAKTVYLEDVGQIAQTGAEPEHSYDLNQIAEIVKGILDSLPSPRDRLIMHLFYLEDQSKEDICRELALNPIHFDKIIYRARTRLKHALEARGLFPEKLETNPIETNPIRGRDYVHVVRAPDDHISERNDVDLEQKVLRIIQESGNLEGFNATQWLSEWLSQPVPALNNASPGSLLTASKGRSQVSQVLSCMQSGAYL